jgi:hypothetical protein
MSNEKKDVPASPYTYMASGITDRFSDISGYPKDITNRIVKIESGPRPEYYGGKDNPYEVFRVLEEWGLDKDFYLGNVIKYVARAGKKDPAKYKEDLQKAVVYLQKRIDSLDK